MGMSATQARYLSLIAQQSNLEYQGQQINQERSILSQQVSELYNSLLNLQVPTPPSTSDFTTVEYQGTMGATKFNIPASNIKPGADGKYTITFEETAYGDSLALNKGYGIVNDSGKLQGNTYNATDYKEGNVPDGKTIYVLEDNKLRPLDPTNDFTTNPETGENELKSTVTLFVEDSSGATIAEIAGADSVITIAGSECHTLDDARANNLITEEMYNGFVNAINNTFPKGGSESYSKDDFYIYKDSANSWHFALKDDVQNGDGCAMTYDYVPNGEFTTREVKDGCGLTFDPGSGRIVSVQMPVEDAEGNIISYTNIDLEAVQVTDELAYDEAVNQYEYAQYEYDRQQQEINARTEVIQQQDRNLELKLQRLDTQRTQITTEIEALKKVIGDNIESSYKTFSG